MKTSSKIKNCFVVMFVNKLWTQLKSIELFNVIIGLTLISIICLILTNTQMSSSRLLSVDYKVFGEVQGVFFRKFTKLKANELGLFGWVQNSRDGTVIGTIQGSEQPIGIMKNWLQKTGSPYSRIDSCLFTNERVITRLEFSSFDVKH